MHTLFIILDYLSVFVMTGCVIIVATHESGKMQKLAMMVCMMLLFCCTGFLIKAEAQTASAMIAGQKIVYATVTHSMLLMLLFILEYCHFKLPKILEWIFHGINLFITIIVLTLDHHDLFYADYWVEEVNGKIRERNDNTDLIIGELDLNGLKEVNDTVGHKAGDEIIIGYSDVLREVFADGSRIFRTGGDEFFIILEDPTVDIPRLEQKLEAAIGAWHGSLNDSLSISYGFIKAADYPDKTIDELMILADKKMYRYKAAYYAQSGKDRRHSGN